MCDAQLVDLVSHGLTDKQIGLRLSLSESRVHHVLGDLYRELAVANRKDLAAWAVEHGYRHAGAAAEQADQEQGRLKCRGSRSSKTTAGK